MQVTVGAKKNWRNYASAFILVPSVLGKSESVGGSGQVADGLSQKSTEDARIELLLSLIHI